jgi:hypothetical protein
MRKDGFYFRMLFPLLIPGFFLFVGYGLGLPLALVTRKYLKGIEP